MNASPIRSRRATNGSIFYVQVLALQVSNIYAHVSPAITNFLTHDFSYNCMKFEKAICIIHEVVKGIENVNWVSESRARFIGGWIFMDVSAIIRKLISKNL